MRDLSQRVIDSVTGWDGIESHPHRFGGVEFKLGKAEIGHVHVGMGLVDIRFTRRTREALVAEGEAEPHHILPESGWISFWMRDPADADQAIRLLRLSYLHKRRDAAALLREAESLGFSGSIMDTLKHREPEVE